MIGRVMLVWVGLYAAALLFGQERHDYPNPGNDDASDSGSRLWALATIAGVVLGFVLRYIGVSIDRISDVVALGALPGIVIGLALVLLLRGAKAH